MTGTVLRLQLASDGLSFSAPGAAETFHRLTSGDRELFGAWTSRYRKARDAGKLLPDVMSALGREIFLWLDGAATGGAVSAALADASPPVILELVAPKRPDAAQVAILDMPWELLADSEGHLAGRPDILYLPVRRLGSAARSIPAPSSFRLSLVFMAAAPRGSSQLNFEEEEAAIQQATGTLGLDLTVEESGSVRFLAESMAREAADSDVDVLHLSCHGALDPPRLLLEDELGDPDLVSADELADALGDHLPRLLFLSACETASPERVLGALAPAMLLRGLPAVLGWAGSVRDSEAIRFAHGLYGHLANQESLLSAVVRTRRQMLDSASSGAPPSRDWHAARLFLGTGDGGALSQGTRARRRRNFGYAQKVFLDRRNHRIPVAGPLEFVGRRRPIQAIVQAFREPEAAGVLVHGLGRQGKSSLAARIAQRFDRHELIVVHGLYDENAIFNGFAQACLDPESCQMVEDVRARALGSPELLEAGFRALLEGPFREEVRSTEGVSARRPALLVLDDFERALEPDPAGAGPHRVRGELRPTLRALILAFRSADTASRLLLTSRFAFTLSDGQRDLAKELLLDLPLPAMVESEGHRQAAAKVSHAAQQDAEPEPALVDRVVHAARGNPGLQDLLFSLAIENPSACQKALSSLESYLASGNLPGDQEGVREFLESLALGEIFDLLSPGQRELLRRSTLFEVPVPRETLDLLGSTVSETAPAGARLLALGLWEVQEDPAIPGQPAVAINALARPRVGTLEDEERSRLAALVACDLYERWGETPAAVGEVTQAWRSRGSQSKRERPRSWP